VNEERPEREPVSWRWALVFCAAILAALWLGVLVSCQIDKHTRWPAPTVPSPSVGV